MCMSMCGAEHSAWHTGLSKGYLHSMVMVIVPLLASFGSHGAEGAVPVWFCCLHPRQESGVESGPPESVCDLRPFQGTSQFLHAAGE